MNEFVTKDGHEICVSCEKATEVKRDEPVQNRQFYIEGAGQLCKKCYDTIIGRLKVLADSLNEEEQ